MGLSTPTVRLGDVHPSDSWNYFGILAVTEEITRDRLMLLAENMVSKMLSAGKPDSAFDQVRRGEKTREELAIAAVKTVTIMADDMMADLAGGGEKALATRLMLELFEAGKSIDD